MNIQTVYTHDDFDGIGSAALFRHHFKPGTVRFSSPKRIVYEPVGAADGVLDLPFARECAIWFDHHEQNFDEPRFRGIDPASIAGLREPAPSCARVILTYYERQAIAIPDFLPPMVAEIDKFDSMSFTGLDDWLRETPGKIVNESLFLPGEKPFERNRFYLLLIDLLQAKPLAEAARDRTVMDRYQTRRRLNDDGRGILRKVCRFHPNDPDHRVLLMDFTTLKYAPAADKKLALIDFPEVDYLLTIYPHIENQVKTNTVTLSLARNFLRKNPNDSVDWGEFFAQREIGGGHRDAAGARLDATSRSERDKQLDALINEILAQARAAAASARGPAASK